MCLSPNRLKKGLGQVGGGWEPFGNAWETWHKLGTLGIDWEHLGISAGQGRGSTNRSWGLGLGRPRCSERKTSRCLRMANSPRFLGVCRGLQEGQSQNEPRTGPGRPQNRPRVAPGTWPCFRRLVSPHHLRPLVFAPGGCSKTQVRRPETRHRSCVYISKQLSIYIIRPERYASIQESFRIRLEVLAAQGLQLFSATENRFA